MIDIRQGDALALDPRALKAAMAAYYEACPSDPSGKRRVESAIRAYLLAVRRMIGDAERVPVAEGQLGLPL